MAIIFCGNYWCPYNEEYYCQAERIEVDSEGKCLRCEEDTDNG